MIHDRASSFCRGLPHQRAVDYYREMTDLSDVAADKVQALLSIDLEDIGDDLGAGAGYCATCRAWFAALSAEARPLAERIREVLADGNETKAEWLVSALPAVPRFPLPP